MNLYEILKELNIEYNEVLNENKKANMKGIEKVVNTSHLSFANTYEVPGGHRETGEDILETAKRELNEETGAIDFDIKPICAYSVTAPNNFEGQETFGMLYYADIKSFDNKLCYEIEKVILTDDLVDNWTYPEIQPKLLEEARRRKILK